MAEQKFNIKSGFYNSINQDRLYNAEDMNRPYSRLISEGIFATREGTPSTDFQVLATDNGMNITVKKGEAMLAKKWIENPSDITITVSNNTGIVPRKDSIILQVDKKESGRIANVIYREGTASSNPVPPMISNNEDIVEMRIANIYVVAGVSKIEQLAITDLRGSSECLWITSLIQQVDTSELFRQWQQAYKDLFKKMKDELQNVEDGSAYLLKTGGKITGDLTVDGHIKGTASAAEKLHTAYYIGLTGEVFGGALFDGTGNAEITTTLRNFIYKDYKIVIKENTNFFETDIDFPYGCNSQNCVVLSCMYAINNSDYKYVDLSDKFSLTFKNDVEKIHITITPELKAVEQYIVIKLLLYKNEH